MKYARENLIKIKISPIEKELKKDSKLNIKLEFYNNSKNIFTNLEIKSYLFRPKKSLEFIDIDDINLLRFGPGEKFELKGRFKILRSGKIRIKGIILSCKDINNNLHEFKSNSLFFKVEE